MANFGKLGRDEGKHTGPPPGDGSDVAHSPDTDGTPGDELPDTRSRSNPRSDDTTRPTQRIAVPDQVTAKG
jgi:hypothetical protein